MGTRGCWGFYKNGEDKLTYNHYDSYPSFLGSNIVQDIKESSIKELNKTFKRIEMVEENSSPSPEIIKKYQEEFSDQNLDEAKGWYSLLRYVQGDLESYLKGKAYHMIDNKEFIKDSLFCEWAYIINLDSNNLEIYKGFQKSQQDNRYKVVESSNGYYNCKLIEEISLREIIDDTADLSFFDRK